MRLKCGESWLCEFIWFYSLGIRAIRGKFILRCHWGRGNTLLTGLHRLFYFHVYLFIYFWLCWVFVSVRGLSLVAASGGHSSLRCAGLSLSWPLLLRSTGSRRAGSVVVAHGPSCSAACGIFPDQGSNPCPLHCQADSQPLRHRGSPFSSWYCRSLVAIVNGIFPHNLAYNGNCFKKEGDVGWVSGDFWIKEKVSMKRVTGLDKKKALKAEW